MKKNLTLTLLALLLSVASFALTPITGTFGSCVGGTSHLRDTTAGGTWSTSSASIASVDASIGMVYGIAAGTATITYTLGSAYVTASFSVNPPPAAITGIPSTFCPGSTATLSDATSGGTWSSSTSYIASINASTGIATAVTSGSTTIYYTLGTGCSATATLTVTPTTLYDSIIGPTTLCVGSTYTCSIATGGGSWSSSNPSIATVSSSGALTGVSAGTMILSYTVSTSCGTSTVIHSVTVTGTTSAGTISGTTTLLTGSTSPLSESVSGGTWSTSSSAVASVDASTGLVYGVSSGTATISYTVSGCSGAASATTTVTVTAFSGISGHVLLGSSAFYGNVKVWLITYNTSTMVLQAVDSVMLSCSGAGSVYYQFLTAATDSYRVKATAVDTFASTTGYIPTYHTSSYYWYSATVFYHAAGGADINKDINMAYGATTTGPGFIGGNVTTGANRGTSTAIPAVGLTILLVNTSTSTMVAKTVTDASGNYSFSNLPVGQTYMAFPEALNYVTTSYSGINLTSSASSRSAISFIQHTLSKTITPIPESVISNKNDAASITTFPNPANGKLNIQWNEIANEKGTLVISDITGSTLYTSTINMTQGAGTTQVDISGLANGLYILTIKSNSINYTNKVQVQH